MEKKYFFTSLIVLSSFLSINSEFLLSSENIEALEGLSLTTNYLKKIPINNYILGSGDRIQVIVSRDYPELDSEVLVNGEGQINLPLLKKVYVENLTPSELANLLNEAYKEYVKYPEVEIEILDYRPIQIYIEGEVENPGLHLLMGALTFKNETKNTSRQNNLDNLDNVFDKINNLNNQNRSIYNTMVDLEKKINNTNYYFPTIFDAIQKAGGITEFSDLSSIELIRNNSISNGGGKVKTSLNFEQVLEGVNENQNIRIYDKDIIKVYRSEKPNTQVFRKAVLSNLNPKFIDVFVAGRVNIPGKIQVSKASVLSDALDMAGGTKALKGPIRFIRFNNDGTIDKRKFKYRATSRRGSFKNPILRNGDLIVVGNSIFNTTNEIILEFTAPFSNLFSTYALIEAISD